MRITVVGTGVVGRTLAADLAALGHDVVVGTRDPEATRLRDEWELDVPLLPYDRCAAGADLVVNAVNGVATPAALAAVGADQLEGRVLLDVSNPLDFGHGFPPTLTVKDTDSLAEQVQRAFPGARVVKALNTMNAGLMLHPDRLPAESTVLVAGDDPDARAVVAGLLRDAGWTDVLELDRLEAARGLEMWLPLWLRLMGALGTADFNLKIVR